MFSSTTKQGDMFDVMCFEKLSFRITDLLLKVFAVSLQDTRQRRRFFAFQIPGSDKNKTA